MQILIRAVGTKVNDDVRRYLRKKILKYDLLMPNSATVECTFEQKGGPKRDGNKIVHLKANLPGARKPIFVKSKALPDFQVAIDNADSKFNRVVHKQLELQKFSGKRTKYYWARVKELPRRTLGRFRKK